MASRGYNMSGNELEALKNTSYDQYYNQGEFLGNLAGAQFGPGQAGANYMQGFGQASNLRQQANASLGNVGRSAWDLMVGRSG
jgi:hypothetical protein